MKELDQDGITLDNLNISSYKLDIERLPYFNYKIKNVDIPGMTLGVPEIPTPFQKMKVPGDEINYEPLTVTFLIDENLYNYTAISRWIRGLGFPDSFDDFVNLINIRNANSSIPLEEIKRTYTEGESSDITLHLLTNHRNPNKMIKFYRAFPTALSGFTVSNSNTTSEVIEATATFEFTGMEYFL